MTGTRRRIEGLKREIKNLRRELKDSGLNRSTLYNVKLNAREQVRRYDMALELSNKEDGLEEKIDDHLLPFEKEDLKMRIKRFEIKTGLTKIIYFDDAIENLAEGNLASINRVGVNYTLLNNQTIKTDKHEFSRCR